ncbi:hypothetical protein [Pararhodobacter zhoushanensis]|uniref:Uncharacterized protein n=1 Tax=Pararhodobacter zhoushanensis TaxID=2479545 RepID=A0ABT3GW32_9RHOB|nr:hypothetical protein [Pararhodobacter zhoushanensis]MCW1931733.1 hypothetical protein [Pararhodobacter zhoushanensis]
MKRRLVLEVTQCAEKRFDNYHFHKNLPFIAPEPSSFVSVNSDGSKRRADYSARDAFDLRMMMEFTDNGGVDVNSAKYAASNAWRKLLTASERAPTSDLYLVLVQERPVEGFQPRQLFAGTLDEVPALIAENTAAEAVQRIVLVNASEASRFVVSSLKHFGVISDEDQRPAWLLDDAF